MCNFVIPDFFGIYSIPYVKKVLGVVVELLKDRACAKDDPPSKKKARIEEYCSKK